MMTRTRSIAMLALAALLLSSVGCTNNFKQEWNNAAAAPGDATGSPFVGQWEGTWQSDRDGHSGPLRCVLTDVGGYQYRANFYARFAYIMPVFTVVTLNGVHDHTGQTPRLRVTGVVDTSVGDYTYDGVVTADEFICRYTSTGGDFGTFTMHRPGTMTEQPADQPAAIPAPEGDNPAENAEEKPADKPESGK